MHIIGRVQSEQINKILGFSPILVYDHSDENEEEEFVFCSPFNPARTKQILQDLINRMSDVGDMNTYFNVVVTIRADDQEMAEQIVERGVDKQGWVVYDVAAMRIKDEDIVRDLNGLDEG